MLEPRVSRPLLWLLAPLALTLAPHVTRLPWWIFLSWLACAGFVLLAPLRGWPAAGGLVKTALAAAGVLGVLAEYGTVLGPRGGVALLIFLSGAKLLETRTARDRMGLLFVGCFIVAASFLDNQSPLAAAYMAAACLGLLAGLVATQWEEPEVRPVLRGAGRLALQALPLALLFFLLFPRLQGPLWGLPHQAAGVTGLSDRMAPGEISRLILSDELAFRAEFLRGRADLTQLYWRGPVLWDFDGQAWFTSRAPGRPKNDLAPSGGGSDEFSEPGAQLSQPPLRASPVQGEGLGEPLQYAITLEPQGAPWLPLLGLPARRPDVRDSWIGPDLQWQTKDPITRRLRYEVEAYADYRLEPEADRARLARALALPAQGNARARELARSWLDRGGGPQAVVEAALRHFREEPFHYTLNPPLLENEPVDRFLFETRRGFCEHYAGAFVFLMRAAGVPARVVTGYQGGEWNALAGHWIVRGRDAHAWAEVWLPGRGWMRADPTAAVAPSRVERGINAALPAGERAGGLIRLDAAWFSPLRLGWDLLHNHWNQWVLGYNQERQRNFLAALNPLLAHWQGMVGALAGGAALLLGLALLAHAPRRQRIHDPALRAWLRFQKTMKRAGVAPKPAEAPEDYAQRARAARPDLNPAIGHLTRLYLACRYGRATPEDLAELTRAARDFRPSRQAPVTLGKPFTAE